MPQIANSQGSLTLSAADNGEMAPAPPLIARAVSAHRYLILTPNVVFPLANADMTP